MIIGIDFDNTIACYDELLTRLARERGFLPADFKGGKKAIRDHIRTLPDGENEWQRLQAVMYGPAIDGARPFDGVLRFLRRCRTASVPVHIVSHKTAYSNLVHGGANFRDAATRWMQGQGFFDPHGIGVVSSQVHYEATRHAKIERLRGLGCKVFIDDLEETFAEPTFPAEVKKILFNPCGEQVELAGVVNCTHWSQIEDVIFHDGSPCR